MTNTSGGSGRASRPRTSHTDGRRDPGSRRALLAVGLLAALTAAGCAAGHGTSRPAPSPTATVRSWDPHSVTGNDGTSCDTVAVAAGDIVNDVAVADRTGRLANAQHPDLVLVLGDNQYDTGALADYREEYDRTAWGALRPITNPVPGNHEYRTPGAAGYFAYFDGPPRYYAYEAGCGWRGYALDSEAGIAEQIEWLRRDLAAHLDAPVLLSWHRPLSSSGTEHGGDPTVQPFWDALAGRQGVVLNGHEHNYERFAPVGGVREFVVGTGGSSTYPFGAVAPGSQERLSNTPGVLRLDLHPGGYRWSFLTTAGAVADSGSG